jgi:hypothetical protein
VVTGVSSVSLRRRQHQRVECCVWDCHCTGWRGGDLFIAVPGSAEAGARGTADCEAEGCYGRKEQMNLRSNNEIKDEFPHHASRILLPFPRGSKQEQQGRQISVVPISRRAIMFASLANRARFEVTEA